MEKIINLGILAHVDAGKTTVTEAILYHSGIKKAMGNVDKGTTTTDNMPLERQRGMTIRSVTVSFNRNDCKINLIDTPGHMDFIAEVMRTLSVLDGVVLVISAKESVQSQTRVIFNKLKELNIPIIMFVNKVDRPGVCIENVLADILRVLSGDIVIMQEVFGEGTKEITLAPKKLSEGNNAEAVLLKSERLFTRYTGSEALSEADFAGVLKEKAGKAELYPVYFGSSLFDIGITELLDGITEFFNPEKPDSDELSAFIYKIEYSGRKHKLIYVRVFSGSLHYRQRVPDYPGENMLLIANLFALKNGAIEGTGCISAGDIGVLADIESLTCGSWLGKPYKKSNTYTQELPLLAVSVSPGEGISRRELLDALKILSIEDPMLSLAVDLNTEEITIKVYGRLELEILESFLMERFNIRAAFSSLKTIFMEKPAEKTEAAIRIGQPGNPFNAGMVLSIEPLSTGAGILYENLVSYGHLEKPFQNAAYEGILKGLSEGLGCQVTDVRVTFIEADYDSVSGTPSDFRALAPVVVKKALSDCAMLRMEPWQSFTLTAPLIYEKRIISELMARRAEIDNVICSQELEISGAIPLDSSKDYAAELLIKTGGKGTFYTRSLGYRVCERGK